jgi:uncharacterized protein YndB with AHSA1/START domain
MPTMSLTETYFAISRRVAAPRERVFEAWIDAPFVYQEVDPPARLVFTLGDDALAIVTLAVAGDETVMTFEGAAPADEADAVERDWSGLLDLLAAQVSQSRGNAGGILPG